MIADPGPTSANRWSAVAAIAAGALAVVVLEFVPVGVLPQVTAAFGVSNGAGGFLVTGPAIFAAITALLAAVAIRDLDRRTALLGLTLLVAVSAALAAVSTSFAMLMATRCLLGICVGGTFGIGVPAAAGFVDQSSQHTAAAMVYGGIGVGSVTAVPLGAALATGVGWRWAFVGAAVIAGLAFIVQLAAVPRIPPRRALSLAELRPIFQSRPTRAILLITLLRTSAQFASYTFMVLYLERVTGFSNGAASLITLGFGLLTVGGNFGGGTLVGRSLTTAVIVIFTGLAIGMTVVATLGRLQIAALIGLAIWAPAWGGVSVTSQQWMRQASGEFASPEASMAALLAVSQLSIAVGSLVGGLIVSVYGVHVAPAVGAIASGSALIVTVMALLASRNRVPNPAGAACAPQNARG